MASPMGSNGGIGKRLLTPKEAAEFLGLQVDTVYKKSRLRELPSVKVGKALRFDVVALNRYGGSGNSRLMFPYCSRD